MPVVDEAMTDARARRERGQISSTHRMQVAVDPSIDLAFNDIDELLFVFLSMRPGRTSTGRQALQVDADANKASRFAYTTHRAHWLVTLRIDVTPLGEVVSGNNERWARCHARDPKR